MHTREYSPSLGVISPEQFQAALDRFGLGTCIQAEPIPFGFSKRNVFLTSSTGEYVFRGAGHSQEQFLREHFFAQQLHERTCVPAPWPYLVDTTEDIFGWSYAIMPRMPGLQLADPEVRGTLGREDRRGIARAIGENLAWMQELRWPHAGQYNARTNTIEPFVVPYSEWVIARILHNLARSRQHSERTTDADVRWVEKLIAYARYACDDAFQPCFVMQDYKENNVVVECTGGQWRVSGIFDFTHTHFGDGEADFSQLVAMYLDEDPELAGDFMKGYTDYRPLRPGFAGRFPLYMLDNRLGVWEFFQLIGRTEWNEEWTLREWASRYTAFLS